MKEARGKRDGREVGAKEVICEGVSTVLRIVGECSSVPRERVGGAGDVGRAVRVHVYE